MRKFKEFKKEKKMIMSKIEYSLLKENLEMAHENYEKLFKLVKSYKKDANILTQFRVNLSALSLYTIGGKIGILERKKISAMIKEG
jgi:hypothetical protein